MMGPSGDRASWDSRRPTADVAVAVTCTGAGRCGNCMLGLRHAQQWDKEAEEPAFQGRGDVDEG